MDGAAQSDGRSGRKNAHPMALIQRSVSLAWRTVEQLRNPATAADLRHRKIALSAATSLASRASGLLLTYLSVSLAVGRLGAVSFGIWMTINAMSILLPFADFGLGNGLISYVSRRIGQSREDLVGPALSAGLVMTSATGVVLASLGMLVCRSRALELLFRHQSASSLVGVPAATQAFVILLAITLPLSLVEKVQLGAQDGYITNMWQAGANVLACSGILIVSLSHFSLLNLVLAYSGIPVLAKACNFATYFRWHKELAPSPGNIDWRTGKHLLQCGLAFVLLQSSVAIGYTCDNLILAYQSGTGAVAVYDVVQRLFSITVVAELSIIPLWGAFGEALGRGDIDWVRRTFYRSLKVNGLLATMIVLPLLFGGNRIVALWTHGRINAPVGLLAAFALWKVFGVVQGNLSVLLNHEITLRRQSYYFAAAAVIAFALKFPFLSLFGTPGVIFATVLSFGLVYALPCMRMANTLLRGGARVVEAPQFTSA